MPRDGSKRAPSKCSKLVDLNELTTSVEQKGRGMLLVLFFRENLVYICKRYNNTGTQHAGVHVSVQ